VVGRELARASWLDHPGVMHTPGKGEGALRRYRVSLPGTSYFLTLCADNRTKRLTCNELATAIRSEISAIESDGHWVQCAGVIMPDHLHLLIRLIGDLGVSRCVARLKAKTRSLLLTQGVAWQPNFYEHRLRPDDSIEDVLRYIFHNPYQDGVTFIDKRYPWFWLGPEEDTWFKPGTDNGRPFPEWLR
jgi:REP element-mobilizing transposase RayT